MRKLHPNIPRLYLIKIAKWFMLYMPIVVPFYQSNGLSMKDIMILQAVYSVAIVILEVPSGYLADVIGRRKTIILGAVMGTLGFATYSLSHGLLGFLIAEIILGIGQSLISGADSAMLYDSLQEDGKQKDYTRLEGRITSLGNLAEAGAAILGGLLAGASLRYPYIGQTLVAFMAVPAAISLKEPVILSKKIGASMMDIVRIARYALFEHVMLRRNILFSAITGTATLTMAWFTQPWFEFAGIDLTWFGLLWAAVNLTVALASYSAHRVESFLGERRSILLISIMIPLGYIALSRFATPLGLIVLFIFLLVRGFATPVLKDYINRVTQSNVRATVLSVRNFIIRLLFAMTGPLLGWAKDIYSLPQALLLAGCIFFCFSLMAGIIFISGRKGDQSSSTSPS